MERSKVFIAYEKKYTSKNAQVQFSNAGFLPILLGVFMLSAMFIPYIIAVLRGTMNPVLPFISQAAGSPPQSGFFSVFLSLSATVGFIGLHLLHLGICIFQKKVLNGQQATLHYLNKAALIPGHLALLGMIVVGGFPIDFHRHREDWILVTILPHLTGACLLFAGGVLYCIILTLIMTIIFPQEKKLLFIRLCLLSVTILTALMHVLTVRDAFHLEYYDDDRLKSCHTKRFEYDSNYIMCSICEWLMAVTFISFFLTMKHEGKLISVTVAVDLLDNGISDQCSVDLAKSPSTDLVSGSTECILQKRTSPVDEN